MDIFLIIFLCSIAIILILYVLRYLKLSFPKYFSSEKKISRKKTIDKAKTYIKNGDFRYAENLFSKLKNTSYQNMKHFDVAYKHFENENFEKAIDSFLNEKHKNLLSNNDLFHIGLSFYKLSKFEQAKEYLLRTVQNEHTHTHALKHLINLHSIDGSLEDLYKELEKINMNTDSINILETMSDINIKLNNKRRLNSVYLRILKIDQNNDKANLGLKNL